MTSLIDFINQQFDATWNRNDFDGVLKLFSDDAQVITLPALPGAPDTYAGKTEIAMFVQALMQNFHVNSKDFSESNSRVYWYAEVSSDSVRAMGVAAMGANCEAVIQNQQIKLFKVTFTNETLAELQAAAQARAQ